jgi:hypothetical protein
MRGLSPIDEEMRESSRLRSRKIVDSEKRKDIERKNDDIYYTLEEEFSFQKKLNDRDRMGRGGTP